jgi:hypothetical protein
MIVSHGKNCLKFIHYFIIFQCIYSSTKHPLIVLFVETPRKFITAKLSIRKPGSSD